MDNKVGMLSFHESLSFGATLQCFALQKTVADLGYSPEFIDFQRKKCLDFRRAQTQPSFKGRVKRMLINLATNVQNLRMKQNNELVQKRFIEFKESNLKIGNREYCSIDDVYSAQMEYDTFITGSDQVWNPFNSVLPVYGLGFVPNNCNTIAYAASIGVSEIPKDRREVMYEAIHQVRHVSCREKEGTIALKELLQRDVVTVLDPTLLLEKQQWIEYAKPMDLPERYVLCFFLGSLEYPRRVAREIAKRYRCKLLVIPGSPKDAFSKGKIVKGCGPSEFLELFSRASFICTDSFHGTAFAINMNRPFYSFCRRGYNEKTSFLSRITDFLQLVGLSDRLIYPDSMLDYNISNIDFTMVNEILEKERRNSLLFLNEALEG